MAQLEQQRMTPERWRQVTGIFHAALTHDASARGGFLDQACAADGALRAEVDAMLAAQAADTRFGEPPVVGASALGSRLGAGMTLGAYRIERLIGAGGMGEVYRARDTRLGRDVALKLLPASFAADPDRVARFEREARMLAALNHPHVAAIYGLEEAPATSPGQAPVHALVLELVEGPTLADRLTKGPLPLPEALDLARQIAEALEAAHEKGVVHRDLKPANIKVTPGGVVKVLDFGLAKAFVGEDGDVDVSQMPTVTVDRTAEGVIAGTPAYMSPEQARGQAVDKRADVWAFGCVLYEMLTGRQAFAGENVSDTLANVLTAHPDWGRLPGDVPARVRLVLGACLQKDQKQRIAHMPSVRLALEGAFDAGPSLVPESASVSRFSVWQRRLGPPVVAALATALVGGFAAWSLWPAAVPREVDRFDIVLRDDQTFRAGGRPVMALSPDGRRFVYNTTEGLYLRRLGELQARVIPGTELPLDNPFFSPDGQTVGYWQEGALKRMPINGGTPTVIAEVESPFSVHWATETSIFFGQSKGIMRVSASGGTPELVVRASGNEAIGHPQLFPDGGSLLFSVTTHTGVERWDRADIVVQSLRTGDRKIVWRGGRDARYVSTGHLVYAVGDVLFAVAFDLGRLEATGGPVPVIHGISAGTMGAANYGISESGSLVYLTAADLLDQVGGMRTLVWVNRDGRETPLPAPTRSYVYPRISPDGGRVALDVRDEQHDIWIWDLTRQVLTRLTFEEDPDQVPAWSPDGTRIAFSATRRGESARSQRLLVTAADGRGAVERVAEGERQMFPAFFTPDASRIVVHGAVGNNENDDIAVLSGSAAGAEGAQRDARPLLQTTFRERSPALSPDGRWMAYESNESGRDEIYVRPFPDVDRGRWQVSTGGGIQPLWSRDGRELFYRSGAALMAVPVQTGASFAAGNPMLLFEDRYYAAGSRNYDVSPDGKRFLMIKRAPSPGAQDRPPARFIIVDNWTEELKRLVPAR